MKQLSPYEVMQNEVSRLAEEVSDPTTHQFTDFFVEATAVLASYGDSNQARNATLCARAINNMENDDASAFLTRVEVPGRVYQEMASPSPWPFQIVQEEEESND